MNNAYVLDDNLPPWEKVRAEMGWSGLLLGNGLSQHIWDRFKYTSLFEVAQSNVVPQQLNGEDLLLFERLNTHNFERVLSALSTGITVTEALNKDATFLRERYESIRKALKHLTDVLRMRKGRAIAISIKRGDVSIRERKAQIIAALPKADLHFFDAETHPLGAVGLTVRESYA